MRTLLLTGAGGFIGHHFVDYILRQTNWNLLLLDSFRHKGTYSRLNMALTGLLGEDIADRVEIHKHDLSVPIDSVLAHRLTRSRLGEIDYVVNMASNSAVERSASAPTDCWRNNCEIAINMAEFCSQHLDPLLFKFLHVSTDEVYGDADGNPAGHKEWDSIVPSNPYSASKAAQEALFISYWRTFDLPLVLVNLMNAFGERQDPEKFIPLLIGKIAREDNVPIYTSLDGTIGSRCYIHCRDIASAIVYLLARAKTNRSGDDKLPTRYNISGRETISNLQLAEMVAKIMGKPLYTTRLYPADSRPGYDKTYALDSSKLYALGWEPTNMFEKQLECTVEWTQQHPEWILPS